MPDLQTTSATAAPARRWLSHFWPRPLIAALLIIIPLLYFYPAVVGQITLAPGDGWTQNFGVRVLLGQMLRTGQLPLWNPFIFAGTPLLASIYPGVLYPPNWLFALFSPQAAMNLVVITTYHLTLIGTYLYARRIGATRLGALLAGMAFTFGGYMIAHLGHTSRIAAAAWLPWILLAIEELYLQARWRWVTLGALFIALQLFAGEPQMTLYTVMLAGAYGVFSLLLRERRETRGRFLSAALLMAVAGVLLSLIQLLPEREFLAFGDRAAIDYDYFSQFSLPPRQLFGLFFPYFFGGAAMPPYFVTYWGQWNVPETCGYVGMVTWLLALATLFVRRQRLRGLVWFWWGCAIVTLLLALGSYLPFEFNRVLFKVPVYRLFRAPGRHLFEVTFALGILAGLGATALAQAERAIAKRALQLSTALLGLIVIGSILFYQFFKRKLATEIPVPAQADLLINPDLYFPLLFFVLAVVAAWLFVQSAAWRWLAGPLLAGLLLLDALAWGRSFEWRLPDFNVVQELSDPPAVKLIKERELDLNNFRILSQTAKPNPVNIRPLNFPNVSIARGLQSVNGYDALRFARLAEITGWMTLDGVVTEPSAYSLEHRGFDLLNVKYLIREKPQDTGAHKLIERGGIQFDEVPVNLVFSSGAQAQVALQGTATELAIISAMGGSDHLTTGTPVLRLKLFTSDGRVIERELQAGRDTSEWAYDRPDVRARVQHALAPVIESWSAGDFEGHRYLARLAFDRAEITRIEITHAPGAADVTVSQASLYDAQTNTSTPLNQFDLSPTRWHKLQQFDDIEVFENQRLLPRAWFVKQWKMLPKADLVATIKSGTLPDNTPFDPRETALFEQEWYGDRAASLPQLAAPQDASATLLRYEPNRLELGTRNNQPGLLVVSEIFYRGWEARIDGQPVPVEQVNYLLRAINVPAGAHRIEFYFKAHSFRRGAAYSAFGLLFLLVGGVVWRKRFKPQPS